MDNNRLSENIEEYLEVLYREGNNKEQVSTTKLSKELNIAPGSVTQMLKKLEKLEYIEYVPYKGGILTDKGMNIAQKVIRKHRIIEKFLIDILNIKPKNVHSQACAMEHSLSDEAERALCIMLEFPSVSHANKIVPSCNFNFNNCTDCSNEKDFDNVDTRNDILLSLSELKLDCIGEITFIRGNSDMFNFINELGINIGSTISFNMDNQEKDDVSIVIDNENITVPIEIANNIFIKI